MHLRWCTKRERASNPFSISKRQRRSSVNGGFRSCRSDCSWGTISSSSASSFSFPCLWTSSATVCNSVSLRSPRYYRNEICVMSISLILKDEPNTRRKIIKNERRCRNGVPKVHKQGRIKVMVSIQSLIHPYIFTPYNFQYQTCLQFFFFSSKAATLSILVFSKLLERRGQSCIKFNFIPWQHTDFTRCSKYT